MSNPPCPVSYLASQADWEGNSAFAPPAPFSSLFLVPEGRRAAFPAYRPQMWTPKPFAGLDFGADGADGADACAPPFSGTANSGVSAGE